MRKFKNKKETNVYEKGNHMVGIGPVKSRSVDYHNEKVKNYGEAKINAAKEFLSHYLKFSENELEDMEIVEMKLQGRMKFYICHRSFSTTWV